MGKPEFVYVTYIGCTAEELWEALTKGDFTQRYWYGRRIESDWKPGSKVLFYDGTSDRLADSGEVLEFEPPRRLSYTFRNEFDAQARAQGHSRVRFTIEPFEGMVKLTLVHDELPDQEMADRYRDGWAPILSSLKTFLETGEPMPRLQHLVEKGRVSAEER